MKIQRIYIDTSVIGGCFDPEFAEWSNGLVADFRNGIFQPLLSEVIAAEIADAPEDVQILYAELMSLDAEALTVEESALELADEYQKRGIVSPNFFGDGYISGLLPLHKQIYWSVGISGTLFTLTKSVCSMLSTSNLVISLYRYSVLVR